MRTIHIVEERAPYLLVGRDDDQFAVVERRAGKLYPLHGGRREPEPLSDTGVEHAVGRGWCTESTARRVFEAVTIQYRTLAETLW
jgi:hypothetical protein